LSLGGVDVGTGGRGTTMGVGDAATGAIVGRKTIKGVVVERVFINNKMWDEGSPSFLVYRVFPASVPCSVSALTDRFRLPYLAPPHGLTLQPHRAFIFTLPSRFRINLPRHGEWLVKAPTVLRARQTSTHQYAFGPSQVAATASLRFELPGRLGPFLSIRFSKCIRVPFST